MFCKQLTEIYTLPPTAGVFDEHIDSVQVQSLVPGDSHVTTVVRPAQTWLPSGQHRSHTTSTTDYCRVSQVSL